MNSQQLFQLTHTIPYCEFYLGLESKGGLHHPSSLTSKAHELRQLLTIYLGGNNF